jgi:hypothetical protein
MNNIKIRKATIKDLKEVQKLNLLLFQKEYKEYDKFLNLNWTFGERGTKAFKKVLTNKDRCTFVAEYNGKIIGYLAGGISTPEFYRNLPKVAELYNTLILEKYRNKKIGTKLYSEFVKWCKNKKFKIIKVQASAPNKKAINFYRKNGFKDYTLILENYLK